MYTQQSAEDRLDALYEALVRHGKAATRAGEIVRAAYRIAYSNWNEGAHLGVGYGTKACNPAGRFLAEKCDGKVRKCVWDAWGIRSRKAYDAAIVRLEIAVCEYLDAHPGLFHRPNRDDLFDWKKPDEDHDDPVGFDGE